MARYISCNVENEYIRGSGVVIGAEGSHDDVILRLDFGEMWDDLTKAVIFRDSYGENPTFVLCTTDKLVEDTLNVYDIPVPAEAKRYQGKMMVVVAGYSMSVPTIEDTATNTTTAYFRVLPSDYAIPDDNSITPAIAVQLQGEIDEIKETIADAIQAAEDAEAYKNEASGYASSASSSANSADINADKSERYAVGTVDGVPDPAYATNNAKYFKEQASLSASSASNSASAASTSETNAYNSAVLALQYKDDAEDAEQKIEGMTVSAEGGEEGTEPTVEKTETLDSFNLHFVIPKGDTGPQGAQGVKGDKGDRGDQGVSPTISESRSGKVTTVTVTDAEGTHTFQVHDGADGEGSGDMLKATYDQDEDGVVDDSEKLGGQLPSYYATASALSDESDDRQEADGLLQDQIDAIVSRSDVIDVVNVYDRGTDTTITDIVHYDTSVLLVGDVVKVMQDETRSNAITYYRWTGTTWSYVGSQGPFYTKGEADTKFATYTAFDSHRGNTTMHITASERTSWNAKEDASNKATSITGAGDNTHYPTTKAVVDALSGVSVDPASANTLGTVKYAQGTATSSAFTSGGSYEEYPYRATVTVSGCTANHFAEVAFSVSDAISGKLAPVCETYAGGIYIYASEAMAGVTVSYKVTYNA